MTQAVPQFNLDQNVTDESSIQEMLDSLGNSDGGSSTVFKPGKHIVKIGAVDYARKRDSGELIMTSGDNSWCQMQIVLEGTGEQDGKKIYKFLSVPTTGSLKFLTKAGEESAFPVRLLLDFFNGLGLEATVGNVIDLVNAYLTPNNIGKLVGRQTEATIDYPGAYAKGRKGEGGLEVVIMQKGEAIKDDTGTVLVFKGEDAFKDAGLHAKKTGITFASYPEVVSLAAIEGDNDANGGW